MGAAGGTREIRDIAGDKESSKSQSSDQRQVQSERGGPKQVGRTEGSARYPVGYGGMLVVVVVSVCEGGKEREQKHEENLLKCCHFVGVFCSFNIQLLNLEEVR
jgi:hypothetical protein